MTDTPTEPGKGRPTPSRRDREAANRRPIVVADRSLARKQSREKDREDRARVNAGYAAGEEKYLPARDRGVQKRWVRDWVDARFSVGELVIPGMFVAILVMYLPLPGIEAYITYGLMAFFAIILIDTFIAARRCQQRMNERYGDRAERVRWYTALRCLQLRPMRMPKPQVKRFQFPE